MLLAQVGMKGVEQDDNKQNEKGDVWVGYVTNQASKFADLTKSGEIFIDENTYKELSEENRIYEAKNFWHKEKRLKNSEIYFEYICKDMYVNNIQELEMDKFEYQEDIEIKNELIEELENRILDYSIKEQELKKLKNSLEQERIIIERSKNSIEKDKKEEKYNLLKLNEQDILNILSLEEFKEQIKKQTEEELEDDIVDQIFINSKICNEKMKNYNKAIKYLKISLVILIIVIGIIVVI